MLNKRALSKNSMYCNNFIIYTLLNMYLDSKRSIGVVVRMSILDTEVDGSNPSISMFSP